MKRNIPKTAQHKCCPKYTYTYIPKIHSHRRDPKQNLWQTLTPPAPRAHGPHREADKCTQICLILVTFPYGVTSLMLYSFDCCAFIFVLLCLRFPVDLQVCCCIVSIVVHTRFVLVCARFLMDIQVCCCIASIVVRTCLCYATWQPNVMQIYSSQFWFPPLGSQK